MRIAIAHLRRYHGDLPHDIRELRNLCDDVGLEVKRVLPGTPEPVFVFELLANRGDHHCYAGIARELAGRIPVEISLPPTHTLELGASPVPLQVETPLCLRYTLTPLELPPEQPAELAVLPAEVLVPLIASEAQSVSPIVDATNLANLELGQPTHAFDADRIAGGVTIRLAKPGERALPLFADKPVELPPDAIVIADAHKVLAIAGVIGCQGSEVTDATRRILLESATFDPVAVRKTAKHLHLQTDASIRFERGGDPAAVLPGAGRVAHLLCEHAGARVTGATGSAGHWRDPERDITIACKRVSAYFERDISPADAGDRLHRYGFSCRPTADDRLDVRVPPHRLWDVHAPEDLYEELAKSYGYNSFPTLQPPAMLGSSPTYPERIKCATEEVLTGLGFYEVITSGFYDRSARARLGITETHPWWQHVVVQNAIDRGNEFLKNNCLVHALDVVAENLNLGVEVIKAFEWTRVFRPGDDGCREQRQLWLVATGPQTPPSWAERPRPADFFFVKGIVGELAIRLKLALVVDGARDAGPAATVLHPYRRAAIRLGDRVVGAVGEIHPGIVRAWKIKRARPVYLEIDVDALEGPESRPELELPPVHPPLLRDLAFSLPLGLTAERVAQHMREHGPAWLQRVAVVDLFTHEDDGRPVRSVTFRLTFANDNRRTSDEVNDTLGAIAASILAAFADTGVKQR